jgi:CheY-like chemotaxis protein
MENTDRHMNHVVLADDDQDHGLLFEMILHEIDPTKTVTVVKDGEALINLLSENAPDVLFLDLKMPCKDGLQCLNEIRNTLDLKHLPIVVYSQSSQLLDIQKSFNHDADLYMVKPFNASHLKKALESVFNTEWRKMYTDVPHYYINNRFVPFTA